LKELGIPQLTSEQIEQLSLMAEEAARKYVMSKVPSKEIETLNISAETEGTKPVTLKIDVSIILQPSTKDRDTQEISDCAVKEAFLSAETYLKGLKCHSRK
jgi:hypothetical protein